MDSRERKRLIDLLDHTETVVAQRVTQFVNLLGIVCLSASSDEK